MRIKLVLLSAMLAACQPQSDTAPSTSVTTPAAADTANIMVYPTKPGIPNEWACARSGYAASVQTRSRTAQDNWDAFIAKYELPELQRRETQFLQDLKASTGCALLGLRNQPAVTLQSQSSTGITSSVICFVNPAFGEVNARAKQALGFIVAQQSTITKNTQQYQIGTPAWNAAFKTERAKVRQTLEKRFYCR